MIAFAHTRPLPDGITMAEARSALGPDADQLTDDEVSDMVNAMDVLAELTVELVTRRKS